MRDLTARLDRYDGATLRHSLNVAAYAERTATQMSLEPSRCELIRRAAVLHDLGKVDVPHEVLRKPGPLSEDEWNLMRRHPQIGAEMLEDAGMHEEVEIVIAHHERPDGSGYPHGLSGEEIPLEARILSIADAYEAMTSDRPYRKALDEVDARKELVAGSGSQFDPIVVKRFLKVLDKETPADAGTSN